MLLQVVYLLLCLFSSISVIADSEMIESAKCTRLFPIFEKKFSIPTNTLHSIALKESGKKHKEHKIVVVWPWTVNVEGKGYYFNTKREAVLFVKKQIIKGHENIDVGCMQINLKHHVGAFDSLNQAFDPDINVKYGAEFLRKKYEKLGSWYQAIAHYHSATHSLGSKYRRDIIKIATNMPSYYASLKKFIDKNYKHYYTKYTDSNIKNHKEVFAQHGSIKRSRSNMMIPIPLKD